MYEGFQPQHYWHLGPDASVVGTVLFRMLSSVPHKMSMVYPPIRQSGESKITADTPNIPHGGKSSPARNYCLRELWLTLYHKMEIKWENTVKTMLSIIIYEITDTVLYLADFFWYLALNKFYILYIDIHTVGIIFIYFSQKDSIRNSQYSQSSMFLLYPIILYPNLHFTSE